MRRARRAGLLVVLLSSSCVHSDHLLIDSNACVRQGVAVEIFGEAPRRAYKEIAVVEASKDAWWAYGTLEELRLALCREAAKLGADALIHPAIQQVSYSLTMGGFGTGGSSDRLTAIAIQWAE